MTTALPEMHEHRDAFHRYGPAAPVCPVILSVPHAGRDYPPALLALARGPKATLEALEDRHADRIVAGAIALGATAFIARRPRSWIDLNRDEGEMDGDMVDPPLPAGPFDGSARLRGGLGLVPRRGASGAELWRRRLSRQELAARIATDHRPWHRAIDAAMTSARARFGVAILLDCHSMPPLARRRMESPARIVVGDRHGRSADASYRDVLIAVADSEGVSRAVNVPYAGGHALDRHGVPVDGRHALQLEIDRSLYLDPTLTSPGLGFESTTALVTRMVQALIVLAQAPPQQVAAE